MPIDITKINGYKAEMTADEKVALLLNYEPPAPDYTGYISKTAFDKVTSELSETKKTLKSKMTEDEQKEAERAAKEAEKDALLESLKKEKVISENRAKLLGLGYEEKLAAATAQAIADGDTETVFANQKLHIEAVKRIERAAALAGDPKPPAGSGNPAKDYSKEITEAYANSDYGLAAMLMRQQQEPLLDKK